LVRNLLRKLREKLTGKGKSKKEKQKNNEKTDKSWEKRRAELLANAPGSAPIKSKKKKSTSPKSTKPRSKKSNEDSLKNQSGLKSTHRPVKKSPAPIQKQEKSVEWNPSEFNVKPVDGKKRFHDFNLSRELMHAISDLGFKYCTPIQAELLSHTLAGKDAIGQAQTGTGKTAAFLISIFTKLQNNPVKNKIGFARVLIIAPTRELVIQISNDAKLLGKYLDINVISVFGGMDYQKQRNILKKYPADIIVATPGRLLDFCEKDDVNLSKVEVLVLDEADRMLDMGFIPDVKRIIRKTPKREDRQTMFFSATINQDIRNLSNQWTENPEQVSIDPGEIAVKSIEQKFYIVSNRERYPLLYNLIKNEKLDRVMVFCNRKDEATLIGNLLIGNGIIAKVISGDVDQKKRISVLNGFKEGKINVLVATDVAGRGIHIEGVSHVINYTLPDDPQDYVHRIGRTGRAGASGISISFASEDDSFKLPAIENFIGHKLNYIHPDAKMLEAPPKGTIAAKTGPVRKKSYPRKNTRRR
jgi:ATP-dependent RNA helicase RhlB